MTKFLKSCIFAASSALFGLASSPSHAIAVGQDYTFYISANCTDCANFAESQSYGVSATLKLTNYILGTALNKDNLVSLVYDGSNLVDPFSLTVSGDDGNAATRDFSVDSILGDVTGNIGTVPGANEFHIDFFDDGLFFHTGADGSWSLCAPQGEIYYSHCTTTQAPADLGNNAIFSRTPNTNDVPEPGSLALILGALGSLAYLRRRNGTV